MEEEGGLKFVTGNENKVREAQEILEMELDRVDVPDMIEIQATDLHQVIVHKVKLAYEKLQCPVMVEDSGLMFFEWRGLPGALTKWFEKTVGCDGMAKMLDPFESRDAFAICLVAVHDGQDIKIARGEVKGTIAPEPRGSNGFGWDTIFIPEGDDRTYAEMSADAKNLISHRRRALDALKKQFIQSF